MKGKWTRSMVDTAGFFVKDEVTEMIKTKPLVDVLDYCLGRLTDLEQDESPENDALRVYYGIASIVLVSSRPSQAEQLVPKLEKLITSILLAYRVKPRKSLLSQMYQHLSLAKAYYYSQKGDISKAIIESSIGYAFSRNTVRTILPLISLAHANIVLQKGCASQAADIFGEVRQREGWGFEVQLGYIGEMRSLRLSGRYDLTEELIEAYKDRPLLPGLELYVEWEKVLIDARKRGWAAFEDYGKRGDLIAKGVYGLNKLWLFGKIFPMEDLGIKASTVRQAYQQMIIKDLRFRYGTEVIERMEKIFDAAIPFERRLIMAQELIDMCNKVDIETRMITFAVLAKWYDRNDQKHLAFLAAEDYGSLCLRLSQGANDNLLGIYGYQPLGRQIGQMAVNDWRD